MVDGQQFAKIALSFPGVAEVEVHGDPAFKIGRRYLAMWRRDLEAGVLRVTPDEMDFLLEFRGDVFSTTDHYRSLGLVIARGAGVEVEWVELNMARVWKEIAPVKLVKSLKEAQRSGSAAF